METALLKTTLEKSLTLLEIAHLTDDDHYTGNGVEEFIEESRKLLQPAPTKHFKVVMFSGETHYVDGESVWSDQENYCVGSVGVSSEKFNKKDVKVISRFEL